MTVIREASGLAKKIIPEQTASDENLRLSHFCVEHEFQGRKLLLNTLTGEMIEGEAEREYLIRHRFLVPQNCDEKKQCDGFRRLMTIIADRDVKGYSSYTVLPTTDCNARCFYCFEIGCEKLNMDEKTALDTAEYILKNSPDGKAKLSWFGGEPLFNQGAIDIICEKLSQAGFEYHSAMISNGYLFSDENIETAVKLWKLKNVQITLDGTEELYNKRKAYIYSDGSAYRRVLDNIQKLSEAEIRVSIRLNLDLNNAENLAVLCDELTESFKGNKYIDIYPRLIYQGTLSDDKAKLEKLYFQLDRLRNVLKNEGFLHVGRPAKGLKVNSCMADSLSSVVILPDGRLHSCEHINENFTWGSIYTGEKKSCAIPYWRDYMPQQDECAECPQYPICVKLRHCSPTRPDCIPQFREERLRTLRWQMENEYLHFIEKKEESDNENETGLC